MVTCWLQAKRVYVVAIEALSYYTKSDASVMGRRNGPLVAQQVGPRSEVMRRMRFFLPTGSASPSSVPACLPACQLT